MARNLIKSDVSIRSFKNPTTKISRLSDGDGLYLLIKPDGTKWWRFDYSFQGKRKTISAGVYPDVSLLMARQKADDARRKIVCGIDPSIRRKQDKQELKIKADNEKRMADGKAPIDSFEYFAECWLAGYLFKGDHAQAKNKNRKSDENLCVSQNRS